MIPGWPYSFVAALEPGRTSWTLPLDAVRLGPAPSRHGAALRLTDPVTWPAPAVTTTTQTTRYGTAAAAAWGRPARVRRGFRNIRQTLPCPASAPKPGKPGPGRPPGSKNRHPATRHVGKTVKRDEPKKKTRRQKG